MTAPAVTDASVVRFEANFEEYGAALRTRHGAYADTPHRVTYKKAVRSQHRVSL